MRHKENPEKDETGRELSGEIVQGDTEILLQKQSAQAALEALAKQWAVSVGELPKSWEAIKSRIRIRLVNYAWNKKALENIPHRRYLDLAAVFALEVSESDHCKIALTIRRGYLLEWGITEEYLWEAAQENLKEEEYTVRLLSRILKEITGEKLDQSENDLEAYILTNKEECYGAAGIFRKDVLESFARETGSSFYILPGTLHELILLPDRYLVKAGELKEMVREINHTKVKPTERLSGSVYYYDRERGEVRMVE